MRKLKALVILLQLFIFTATATVSAQVSGSSFEPNPLLAQSIEEKAKELEEINRQIQKTNENLSQLESQKQTLSKQLRTLDYTINQVNLGIKSSQINLSKLALELEELNTRSGEVVEDIAIKKKAVAEAFYELSKRDKENLLMVFLRNQSLVQGAFEAQALRDIEDRLTANIKELQNLHQDLNKTISSKEAKRRQVEIETQSLRVRKALVEEEKKERKDLLTETKNREQIYQQQLSALQKMQDAVSEEIEKLESELRGRIDAKQIPPYRKGTLAMPVPGGYLTQGYGRTSYAIRAYKSKWHNGYDFGKFLGAEIVSAEDGVVVAIGDQDRYCRRAAYGKYIVIKHYNGLTTLYGHLSAQTVKQGQEVTRGQVIGYMGKTGWATGPHLHFVVYDTQTYSLKKSKSCGPMPVGGDINPGLYLASF